MKSTRTSHTSRPSCDVQIQRPALQTNVFEPLSRNRFRCHIAESCHPPLSFGNSGPGHLYEDTFEQTLYPKCNLHAKG